MYLQRQRIAKPWQNCKPAASQYYTKLKSKKKINNFHGTFEYSINEEYVYIVQYLVCVECFYNIFNKNLNNTQCTECVWLSIHSTRDLVYRRVVDQPSKIMQRSVVFISSSVSVSVFVLLLFILCFLCLCAIWIARRFTTIFKFYLILGPFFVCTQRSLSRVNYVYVLVRCVFHHIVTNFTALLWQQREYLFDGNV